MAEETLGLPWGEGLPSFTVLGLLPRPETTPKPRTGVLLVTLASGDGEGPLTLVGVIGLDMPCAPGISTVMFSLCRMCSDM